MSVSENLLVFFFDGFFFINKSFNLVLAICKITLLKSSIRRHPLIYSKLHPIITYIFPPDLAMPPAIS